MTNTQSVAAIAVVLVIMIGLLLTWIRRESSRKLDHDDDGPLVTLSDIYPHSEPPEQIDVAQLSDDQWFELAKRHAGADWESNQPDGYLNAVKALVSDAAPTLLQQAEQEAQRLRDQRDILLNAIRELAGMDITVHGLAGVQRIASSAIEKAAAAGRAA